MEKKIYSENLLIYKEKTLLNFKYCYPEEKIFNKNLPNSWKYLINFGIIEEDKIFLKLKLFIFEWKRFNLLIKKYQYISNNLNINNDKNYKNEKSQN